MCVVHSRNAGSPVRRRSERPTTRVRTLIKTSHLRVYLPSERLGAIPEADAIMVGPPRDVMYGIAAVPMTDDAFVAEWRGKRYLCPRTPRLRMLEGVLAVRHAYTWEAGGSFPRGLPMPPELNWIACTKLLLRREPTYSHPPGTFRSDGSCRSSPPPKRS